VNPKALSIRNITKKFQGRAVVHSLSFDVEPGEIFGLLGPNGAGKSTTINLIGGVARLEEGEIQVFGQDVSKHFRHTRRLVGVTHQEIIIDPFFEIGTALKIQSGFFGVKDDPKWRTYVIEKLALGPHLSKKINRLSGGMKRRYMIAKALMHRPKLLILDEPTAGVDVELRHALWDFVKEANQQGMTLLLTTHYLEEAQKLCNRIAIMKEGRLIAIDKTNHLMKQLGTRHLYIRFENPVASLPASFNHLRTTTSEEGKLWEIWTPAHESSTEVLKKLIESGCKVSDFSNIEPSLEDVFLKLTAKA